MTARSFARRYWNSLTDASDLGPRAPGARHRAGYRFAQRYWAALLGVRLPPRQPRPDLPEVAEDPRATLASPTPTGRTIEVEHLSAPGGLVHARRLARELRHAVARVVGQDARRRILRDLGTGLSTDEQLEGFVREELAIARTLHRTLGRTVDQELAGDVSPSPALDLARVLARALTLNLDLTLDLQSDLSLARELDEALDLAQRMGLDLSTTVELARRRAAARKNARAFKPQGLVTRGKAMERTRAYARAIDLTYSIARELARDLVDQIDTQLMAIVIDAQGADLSALHPSELGLLPGLVWDEQTRWPTEIVEEVRARSREIRTGVWQVVGGTELDSTQLANA